MKQGEVLAKERESMELTQEKVAGSLGISVEEYQEIEAGESPAEAWGARLALIAIELECPTSRLLAESGRFADTQAEKGQAGSRIRRFREEKGLTEAQIAEALKISEEEYRKIEAGNSPLEKYGPLFLGFAEVIEQPVFNLFYPCGLPFQELDDYP